MVAPLKVGIAGLGTVGAEVVRLIEQQSRTLSARCGRGVRVVAVTARSKVKKRGLDLRGIAWAEEPAGAGQRSRHRLLRRIDGRGRRARAVGDRGGAEIRQVGGHRQQGADRQTRTAAGEVGREAWRRAEFRGGGRRGDPGRQDPARGAGGHRRQSRLRHPQRHLQLHPDPDGTGRPVVRRMPEGRAAPRLRRGQPVVRRRRPRHRAEARRSWPASPSAPRSRRARSMSKAFPRSRRKICAPPRNSAIASNCSGSRCGPPRASNSACIRPWCRNRPRSRR